MIHYLYFIYALSIHHPWCYALSQRYSNKHFTLFDGLPSNSINCFFKDSRGIIWIGTENGLVKFDGSRFTIFTTKDGLSGNIIRDIKEDKSQNLWFACYGDGLSKFDGKKFTNYSQKNGLIHSEIRKLHCGTNGKLYVGTERGLRWTYQLTGNPLSNNCWFDYPIVGVSNNEIYVTGNLFTSTSNVFNQAVIYQIPKAAGYTGNSLNWQYWSNLNASPYGAFTLAPASYGHQGNYGPGIYFVSNKAGGDNRIRLWDLTDDMSGSPILNSYTINTTPYSPSPDANQLGTTDKLSNGDCRIQNAFYLNGIVHYVFHSDIGSGWNGINYNRLTVSNSTNQSSTFGLSGSYDYSYPAVIPFSTTTSDKSVMIAFLRSSATTYPQLRVVNCDNSLEWSTSTLVKSGETYVNILTGDERWGDYTGISRKHNSSTPRIWLAGCYGANIVSQSYNNTWKTWVAEIYGTSSVGLSDDISLSNSISMFPNPTYNLINIFFTTESFENISIQILDINGRVVKTLYSDVPKVGENKLTFNKGALTSGTYFVNISTSTKVLKYEKIIILD